MCNLVYQCCQVTKDRATDSDFYLTNTLGFDNKNMKIITDHAVARSKRNLYYPVIRVQESRGHEDWYGLPASSKERKDPNELNSLALILEWLFIIEETISLLSILNRINWYMSCHDMRGLLKSKRFQRATFVY